MEKQKIALPQDSDSDPSTSLDLVEGLVASDRKTIAHLFRSGVGENTLRATRSDLAYLEA